MGIVQANTALGFTASNKEAKRKIGEGAVRVNGEQVFDAAYVVRPGDKLSLGHKKHGLVVAE
jgi:tyrosyl-tRNA synthetase